MHAHSITTISILNWSLQMLSFWMKFRHSTLLNSHTSELAAKRNNTFIYLSVCSLKTHPFIACRLNRRNIELNGVAVEEAKEWRNGNTAHTNNKQPLFVPWPLTFIFLTSTVSEAVTTMLRVSNHLSNPAHHFERYWFFQCAFHIWFSLWIGQSSWFWSSGNFD